MIDFRRLDGRGNFYFLRHGESEGNSARVIQGRHDFALSERGRKQAAAVAGWFRRRGIRRLLSSPLARARETAEIVARRLALGEVQTRGELTELDTGVFTGLSVTEIRERLPEEWRSFQEASWEGVPRAERIAELTRRAERVWEVLADLHRRGAGDTLCVTHSGIMQWIVKVTWGQRDWMPLVPMGNCAVSHFSLDNRLGPPERRYYFEWTRLGYQPLPDNGSQGHLFLEG